jgi:uncharacterized membrane protein YphA (DoxX/SURF4 family)
VPFVLIARLVLAAVFAVAAWGKLSDPTGTRHAVLEFGVPAQLAGVVGFLVPLAELVVACLLLLPGSAVFGAIGALVLLALFTVTIGAALARGAHPDCHCFGQVRTKAVSARTVIRNVLLMGVAVFVLVA